MPRKETDTEGRSGLINRTEGSQRLKKKIWLVEVGAGLGSDPPWKGQMAPVTVGAFPICSE